jgi:serine/threonine protein phosphatase PrpC
LTRDHTLVEEMVRQGTLTAEAAETHRWRHVITIAVGADSVSRALSPPEPAPPTPSQKHFAAKGYALTSCHSPLSQ